ncbi:hypothetical protein ACVCNH_02750 [Achromobacter anxifer]
MDRRRVLQAGIGSAFIHPYLSATAQVRKSFDELFAEAKTVPNEFEKVRSEKEVFDPFNSKAAAPRVKPSARKIAQKAIELIVFFEVTSETNYRKKLTRPIWPEGQSGVTIGIGYDLGAVRATWLRGDWGDLLDPAMIEALEPACQKSGRQAAKLTPTLQHVEVPWPNAMDQFKQRLLPLYIAQTLIALPLAGDLSDTSLGALVSLVYNRGANFTSPQPKRREMVKIKDALASKDYGSIPQLIRDMKRIWNYEDYPGLHKRRDLEAALFEEGLAKS